MLRTLPFFRGVLDIAIFSRCFGHCHFFVEKINLVWKDASRRVRSPWWGFWGSAVHRWRITYVKRKKRSKWKRCALTRRIHWCIVTCVGERSILRYSRKTKSETESKNALFCDSLEEGPEFYCRFSDQNMRLIKTHRTRGNLRGHRYRGWTEIDFEKIVKFSVFCVYLNILHFWS